MYLHTLLFTEFAAPLTARVSTPTSMSSKSMTPTTTTTADLFDSGVYSAYSMPITHNSDSSSIREMSVLPTTGTSMTRGSINIISVYVIAQVGINFMSCNENGNKITQGAAECNFAILSTMSGIYPKISLLPVASLLLVNLSDIQIYFHAEFYLSPALLTLVRVAVEVDGARVLC